MRTRRLNWKLLAWIVGTLAVSAGAVHFAHSAQMKRHARTLLAQVDQEEAAGKPDHAAEYLKRYLTINTFDTDALARYGLLLDKTATTDAARARIASIFEKVLARDRKRDAIRRRVIELYLDLGRFVPKEAGWNTEARQHAELLVQTRPEDSESFELLGRCLAADGEPARAREQYRKAVEKDPKRIEAAVGLAWLLRRSQSDEGDAVMDAMVRANPTEATAYLERATYRLGGGSLTEAGRDLAEAHKLDPKDARILLALADLAQRQGNLEDARMWWMKGVSAHEDDPAMYAGLATLELQQARADAAVPTLRAALKHAPADPELNYLLTEAFLQQNQFEEVANIIAELREHGGQPGLANFLTARLLLNQHRPLEAAKELEETLRQVVLAPGLAAHICLCLGQAYQQIGNGDRQLRCLPEGGGAGAGLVRARVQLGATLLATGATDAATEQLSEATRLPLPPDEAWTLLARALFQHAMTLVPARRDWDKVRTALDRAAANSSQVVPVAQLRRRADGPGPRRRCRRRAGEGGRRSAEGGRALVGPCPSGRAAREVQAGGRGPRPGPCPARRHGRLARGGTGVLVRRRNGSGECLAPRPGNGTGPIQAGRSRPH